MSDARLKEAQFSRIKTQISTLKREIENNEKVLLESGLSSTTLVGVARETEKLRTDLREKKDELTVLKEHWISKPEKH